MSKSATDNLLLHPKTRADVLTFLSKPAHALMIVGEAGSGKKSAAEAISSDLLGVPMTELSRHPFFIKLQKASDKQEIPIDSVRNLLKNITLKTAGTAQTRRVVVIEEAHLLSEEAQNALLKTLEEPAADTVFILTAPSVRSVLPTIASRVRLIPAHSISKETAMSFYSTKHQAKAIQDAWHLSSGSAKLMESILADSDIPLKKSIDEAKLFLSRDAYGKLLMVDEISKDRQHFDQFLEALEKILQALQRSPNNQSKSATSRLLNNRKLVSKLRKNRLANVNTRLIVLELALNLNL
ncbi:AAA family ATPase [Candidatus Saccharibacteria bacterium]|nr:AAA family ATPase [Candidatus Saccharibacteria bacterium]